MRNSLKRFHRGAIAAAVLVTAAACAGPSNEQIASFAQSGVAFTDQVPGVYTYAFNQSVDRDSGDLIRNRERIRRFDPTRRDAVKQTLEQTYDANTQQLEQRLQSFALMKSHAEALQRYFVALNALAAGAESEAAGQAANQLAGNLATLVPRVKAISIQGIPLEPLVSPSTTFIVSSFVNARLQKHLEENAATVEEAISLQRAMFQLLLQIQGDPEELALRKAIRQQFFNLNADLPANWQERRLSSFTFQLQPNPVSVALTAAEELESNFQQLVEGGQGALDRLDRSIAYVEAIVSIFENARTGTTP